MSNDARATQFAFVACQHGAEGALKQDVAGRQPSWNFAFSRPGFVTFKVNQPVSNPEQLESPSIFARACGWSLGKVAAARLTDAATAVWRLELVQQILAERAIADLHVWQRDTAPPGTHGFEPGATALAREIEQELRSVAPASATASLLEPKPSVTPRNRWVLDVAAVEPNQWWVGYHRASSRVSRWAGGVPPLTLPDDAAGRAYLKMAKALLWSALPVARGEIAVELGCAPGGAAQALLTRGLRVIGVDPAEMPTELVEDPNFTHIRRRAAEAPRRAFRDAAWLAADMNVAPAYTLDAVEDVVARPETKVRGLLLTLKLSDWNLAGNVPTWVQRVQSWGFRDVRLRQLAFNRREICLSAARSRGGRRLRRSKYKWAPPPKVRDSRPA